MAAVPIGTRGRIRGGDRPRVAARVDALDPRQRARGQEVAHLCPVVWRPVGEAKDHFVARGRALVPPLPAQLAGRAPVGRLERIVEAPDAAEARGQRDPGHGQPRLVQQALREMQPARLGDDDRGGAHVLYEQPMQVPRADPQARGERADGRLVERAVVDELQRPPHHGRGAEPGRRARRRLRPAAQARPVAGLGGGGGGRVVTDVRRLRAGHRTDRAAVDARGGHRDEELPVEAGIAADARPVERAAIEAEDRVHGANIRRAAAID